MAMASEAEDIISVCGTAPVAAYLFYHTEDKGKAGEKTSRNGKARKASETDQGKKEVNSDEIYTKKKVQ